MSGRFHHVWHRGIFYRHWTLRLSAHAYSGRTKVSPATVHSLWCARALPASDVFAAAGLGPWPENISWLTTPTPASGRGHAHAELPRPRAMRLGAGTFLAGVAIHVNIRSAILDEPAGVVADPEFRNGGGT